MISFCHNTTLYELQVLTYINGQFLESNQACIPVTDRGFRFGDGVFETLRVYNGVMYQWEAHVNRLKEGLTALSIPFEQFSGLKNAALSLIKQNNISKGYLRIAISRGSGSQGYLPTYETVPTLVIETIANYSKTPDTASLWESSLQKTPAASLPVSTKIAQGVNAILARMEAQEHECFEALLLNNKGYISEASSSNIFWVKDKILYTPSPSCDRLNGTVLQAVKRLSPFQVKEGEFLIEDLLAADEIFLTNTGWLILPVTSLHPRDKTWSIGEVTSSLQKILAEDIATYAAHHQS